MNVYFCDVFNVQPEVLEDYGAFNVSVVTDFPLFIDPFLLFHSEKPEYQQLHDGIIRYLMFLREKSSIGILDEGLLEAWYLFREVKQNCFGFCQGGISGNGLGITFAKALHSNLNNLFRDFGQENITTSSHLEKLCLIHDGVGRDRISDFTTTLIKEYLLDYTQTFATQYIDRSFWSAFLGSTVIK